MHTPSELSGFSFSEISVDTVKVAANKKIATIEKHREEYNEQAIKNEINCCSSKPKLFGLIKGHQATREDAMNSLKKFPSGMFYPCYDYESQYKTCKNTLRLCSNGSKTIFITANDASSLGL